MTNVIKFNKEVQVEETPKAIKDLFTLEKDTEGNPVISGRELHEALGMEERYSRWIGRMLKYGFDEGTDFNTYQTVQVQIEGNKEVKRTVAPSTIDKKNNMDVIAQDDKLIQTYIKVVTELASEYKVGVSA